MIFCWSKLFRIWNRCQWNMFLWVLQPVCQIATSIIRTKAESESESEIVYLIDIHRIHLQIRLNNAITHTCKSAVIYGESTALPKIEGRQPESSAVTGGTPSCHNNNWGRHPRRQKPPDRRPSPSAVVDKQHRLDHLNCVIDYHILLHAMYSQ